MSVDRMTALRTVCGGHIGGARVVSRAGFLVLATFLSSTALAQIEWDDLKVRAALDITHDDNVSRAESGETYSDNIGTLTISANVPWNLSQKTRAILEVAAGHESFAQNTGLSRSFAIFKGEFQFRGSGRYGAPIWGVFASQGIDAYRSQLRDGYRASLGVSVRKPWTDKLFMFSSIAYNMQDGRSKVFDTENIALRTFFDYSLSQRNTTYFGLELRDGDIVSTSSAKLAYFDVAEAVVEDDVFTDQQRFSYRAKGNTAILTLGLNSAFGTSQALDFSYRLAYAEPKESPPASVWQDSIYYISNQVTLSYLLRF